MAVPAESIINGLVGLGDRQYCQVAHVNVAGREFSPELEGRGGSTRGEDGARGDQGGQDGGDGKDAELHDGEIERDGKGECCEGLMGRFN